MQIFIKAASGAIVSLEVDETTTLWEIKVKFCWKIDPLLKHPTYLPQNSNLVFENKLLQNDSMTLAEYNIEKESTLHQVMVLRGD